MIEYFITNLNPIYLYSTDKEAIILRVMKRDDNKPVIKSDPQTDSLLIVFKTLGDTTWRMFLPVILGTLVGLWFDGTKGTKYGALSGAIIGLILAGLLVWRQYVSVTKDNQS